MLLPFLRQEGVVLFEEENTRPHTAAATQRALREVQQELGEPDSQISRQMNTYGTWWSVNLLFLQSLPQPLTNCDNGCQMLGTIYRKMAFGTFITVCMRKYTPACRQRGYSVNWSDWALLTVTCVFNLFWICYHIFHNDKLPFTLILYTMNLSL